MPIPRELVSFGAYSWLQALSGTILARQTGCSWLLSLDPPRWPITESAFRRRSPFTGSQPLD